MGERGREQDQSERESENESRSMGGREKMKRERLSERRRGGKWEDKIGRERIDHRKRVSEGKGRTDGKRGRKG